MNPELESKIQTLRDRYNNPDDHKLLDKATADLNDLYFKSKYLENENTIEILNDARNQIRRINALLLAEKLEPLERAALIGERRPYLWYVRLLSKDFKSAMKSIEDQLDRDLAG